MDDTKMPDISKGVMITKEEFNNKMNELNKTKYHLLASKENPNHYAFVFDNGQTLTYIKG